MKSKDHNFAWFNLEMECVGWFWGRNCWSKCFESLWLKNNFFIIL